MSDIKKYMASNIHKLYFIHSFRDCHVNLRVFILYDGLVSDGQADVVKHVAHSFNFHDIV